MRKMNFYLRSLFITLLLICTIQSLVAQKQVLKEVPKELCGFWQFEVKNKGDWNGINLGKNYIEHFYNLSKVDSVVQNDKTYTLHLTSPDRRDARAIIEMGQQKGQATITMNFEYEEPKKYNCKQFELDPDIELLPQSKYPTAIEGEWMMGSDIRKPLAIKGDKLIWNAQEWNIIWLGEYLKKEFRALVELNGHHRLLYITQQNDKSKKLVFGNNVQYYQPIPAKEEQNMLYGTWCDKKTNEWVVGFFDKVAVYKNKTWTYKVLNQKKNNYTIELKNGDEAEVLGIKLKGKNLDVCKLNDGKTTRKLCYTPRPKAYSYPDNQEFTKRAYKLDSVTISGYLLNYPKKNKPFEVSVYDITKGEAKHFYVDIDENGCFSMKIPVINTSQIHLDWGISYLSDVVEPNENYFIFIDYAGSNRLWNENDAVIWHMGKNARLHQEIIQNEHSTKISHYLRDYQGDVKTSDALLDVNRKTYQQKVEELDSYIANNPIQSKRFKTFAYNYLKTELGLVLMQHRFRLMRGKEFFSKRYETYVDSLMQSIDIPYTLTRDMCSFIRDYVGYYNIDKARERWRIETKGLANFIENENLYHFTEEEKKVIEKIDKIEQELRHLTSKQDTILLKERLEFYKNDLEANSKLFRKEQLKNAFLLYVQSKNINNLTKYLDSLPVKLSDDVKDLIFLRDGLKGLYYQQIPLLPSQIKLLMQNIKNEYFRKLLQEAQDNLIEIDKKNIDYLNTLKRTDHLKDAKTADELFKKLTEPYLGKVIYLDIWGTWCAPCKEQMKFVGRVKEAMKGKDVVFMYLANNSPEKS